MMPSEKAMRAIIIPVESDKYITMVESFNREQAEARGVKNLSENKHKTQQIESISMHYATWYF